MAMAVTEECSSAPRRKPFVKPKLLEDHLTVAEAVEALGLCKASLDRLRVSGGGPAYIKLGNRVFYPPDGLRKWLTGKLRTSTSERK